MSFLIRRINRAKWDILISDDVSADAITSCLKTFQNDLSVWYISNITDIENAILALITGSKQSSLSTLHVIILEEERLICENLDLYNTDGDTVVKSLISTHRDISQLNYKKLGQIKNLILDCISTNKIALFTKKQQKDILTDALTNGKLNLGDLNTELVEREKLKF